MCRVAELGSLGIYRVITEEYNKGHSFRLTLVSYPRLCRYLSELPGLVFTRRRRFFWSSEGIGAEFTFRGHDFEIETDGWDGALWILSKDRQAHIPELQELREHIEQRAQSSWILRLLSRRVA